MQQPELAFLPITRPEQLLISYTPSDRKPPAHAPAAVAIIVLLLILLLPWPQPLLLLPASCVLLVF